MQPIKQMEKEMIIRFSILAWKIPWTEGPGGLWSMGLQRVRCDLEIKLEKEMATTPVFLAGECHGQRSLVGCCLSIGSHRVRHD